jgi:hypothetical protein
MTDLEFFLDMLNYAVAVCRKQGARAVRAMEDARYEAKEELLNRDLAVARRLMDDEQFKEHVKPKVRNAARRVAYRWLKDHPAPPVTLDAELLEKGRD